MDDAAGGGGEGGSLMTAWHCILLYISPYVILYVYFEKKTSGLRRIHTGSNSKSVFHYDPNGICFPMNAAITWERKVEQ